MKVSIIIPVYNAEKYIIKCLDSILRDNYFDGLEVICVNDGSADNSLSLINNYDAPDGALKIISQENKGVSSARNTGLANAVGEYVMFVDADDYITQNTLKDIFTIIPNKYPEADWFICGYNRTSRRGSFMGSILDEKTYNPYMFCDLINSLGSNLFCSPWNKIYRRNIIVNNIIHFDETMHISEDAKFNYDYIRYCKSIVTLSILYYNYIVNPHSSTAKFMGEGFWRDMPLYRESALNYIEYAKSLDTPEKSIEDSIYSINDINTFQTLFAIYSIYRAKNRPPKKYRELKKFLSKYNECIGLDMSDFFKTGVPKWFGRSVKVHPYLGHLFLSGVFSSERIIKKMKKM